MFLIAGANMLDPNFSRTVILLCEHKYEGSFGLVLNQPLPIKLTDIVTNLKKWDGKVFRGGPVQENTLHFIHRRADLDLGSKEIIPGIFWGGEFEVLVKNITANKISSADVRFFIGYTGWGEGQLDNEIKRDSWYLRKANMQMIFYKDSRNHWRRIFKAMGAQYKILTNFPDDPRLN